MNKANESLLPSPDPPPAPIDPSTTSKRFYFLFLACLISIGSYFVYDNPAALEIELKLEMHLSSVQYNLLYSICSFPNIIIPLLGGYFIDKFGVRNLIYISSAFVTVGQAIFAFGVTIRSFPLVLVGRGIYGCGSDNLDLSQSVIVLTWFVGKELTMAYGLNSTLSLLGSVLNDNIVPIVSNSKGLEAAVWVGVFVCVLSFIGAIFLNTLDRSREKLLGIKTKIELPEEERFKVSDLKQLNLLYWILFVTYSAVQTSVYCFGYIASGYYQERFGFNEVQAGSIMSSVYFVSAVFCPLFGWVVDKIGKRVFFLIISAFCATVFHLCCMFTESSYRPIYPIFYCVLLGFSYSIAVTLYWSSVPYIISSKIVGTAFGVAYSVGNILLFVIPLLIGYIQDNTQRDHGYYWVSFFFAVSSAVGFISGCYAYLIDMRDGGILHSSNPVLTSKLKLVEKLSNSDWQGITTIN